jgi:hypothetical protein
MKEYPPLPETRPLEAYVALSLPYLSSNKNVGKLFEKILSAQKPSTFTHDYLQNTIGLKGMNDRPLIPLLRNLGFLDTANVPTSAYDLLKNKINAKAAIAGGVKKAYEAVFKANETANDLGSEELKGLISQVSGADEEMVARIAATFSALVKLSDFAAQAPAPPVDKTADEEGEKDQDDKDKGKDKRTGGGLRPEFHYNIQIHLPGNSSEETYLNIFNALRRTFK